MTIDPNGPRRDDRPSSDTGQLLLALAVIFNIAALVVFVTYEHPALTDPLTAGWTAAGVLLAGLAIRRR